jgi:hypothetical protein
MLDVNMLNVNVNVIKIVITNGWCMITLHIMLMLSFNTYFTYMIHHDHDVSARAIMIDHDRS